MKPIVVRSNWGYWDSLADKDLKDGEWLRIKWPDGTITQEVIRVQEGSFYYEDMGHPGIGEDFKAYVERSITGTTVKVWLRDVKDTLMAERIKKPRSNS